MSDDDGTKSVHDEGTPRPHDFVNYFPFACGQFECSIDVRINKMLMTDFVGTVKTERLQQKSNLMKDALKAHVSRLKIASEGDTQKVSDFFTSNPVIIITATHNHSDRLISLKFHKTSNIPRKMIRVLGIIIQFYPTLTSITFQPRINKYIIYEVARLLTISNITEVCLDGCSVSNGNFELLLDNDTGIRILSLARCTLCDPIIKLFAEKLAPPNRASKTLLMLNLSSNRLTDVSAEALGSALRVNRCLRNLNLSDNAITDKGASFILDTMLKIRITESELYRGREDKFKYLKKKVALINMLVQEITKEETEKHFKRHLLKQPKKRKPSLTQLDSELESSHLPVDIRNNIAMRATVSAEATLGDFNHPFYPVTNKDGILTCLGNNSLQSLNLAYTNISLFSVRKLLQIMEYQKELRRKPRGLVNINLEGNNLPISCEELTQINDLMVEYSDTREDTVVPVINAHTRRRLRTLASKASLGTYSEDK